jgi:hypothetical protein
MERGNYTVGGKTKPGLGAGRNRLRVCVTVPEGDSGVCGQVGNANLTVFQTGKKSRLTACAAHVHFTPCWAFISKQD